MASVEAYAAFFSFVLNRLCLYKSHTIRVHVCFCIFIFIHAFSVILQVVRASETEISEKTQPASNVAYNEVLLLIEEIVHSVMLGVSPIETQ